MIINQQQWVILNFIWWYHSWCWYCWWTSWGSQVKMIKVCKLMSYSTFSHHLVCQSAILRWPLCISECFSAHVHCVTIAINDVKIPEKSCLWNVHVSFACGNYLCILVQMTMSSIRFLPLSTTFPLAPTQQAHSCLPAVVQNHTCYREIGAVLEHHVVFLDLKVVNLQLWKMSPPVTLTPVVCMPLIHF